jgi:TatD DNase family protein
MVDFHCHLDLYPDLEKAIQSCDDSKTATLAVTTTPKAFRKNAQLAGKSKFVRVGLGLHPQLVHERWGELPLFEALLPETRYVGEVGLDAGPQFYRSFEQQTDVFRKILKLCAKSGDKILSVHSVRATSKVLDHIEELIPSGSGKIVLHWFSGSRAEAARAAALGCYFSINQEMFRTEKAISIIRKIPLDKIVTETDGPFIEVNGSSIQPGDVSETVNLLASVLSTNMESMRNSIIGNFIDLVS